MTAIIKPYGILKSYVAGQAEVTVKAGRTIRETLVALKIIPELAALVLVNDENQSKDYVVKDGDVIKLMAVMGGG